MTVSTEQAFEARDAGNPITISARHALKLVANHGQNENQFLADMAEEYDVAQPFTAVDLADVLEWLGY